VSDIGGHRGSFHSHGEATVRRASPAEAATVGELLHDFNAEFDTPTPPPDVVGARFARHDGPLVALLADEPAVGIALVSFRPTVWSEGPTALLEELYVRPSLRGRRIGHALLVAAEAEARARGAEELAINVDGEDHDTRRFYEAHGYTHTEPGQSEPSYFYYRALATGG
jgi:GNAT superfamily N-acetyltransferase